MCIRILIFISYVHKGKEENIPDFYSCGQCAKQARQRKVFDWAAPQRYKNCTAQKVKSHARAYLRL